MPSPKSKAARKAILLVEDDVLIRFGIAEFLRECGFVVIEAANAKEARTILVAGTTIDILLSDAQLAGEDNGFALAQWVHRHRPSIKALLTATTAGKIETAASLCTHTPQHDATTLTARIRKMMAERARRNRPPASFAINAPRRKTN